MSVSRWRADDSGGCGDRRCGRRAGAEQRLGEPAPGRRGASAPSQSAAGAHGAAASRRDVIVCVAGGPSLTAAQIDHCRGRAAVLVVNDGYRLAPWADWLYACDGCWWAGCPTGSDVPHHELSRRTFAGERWTRDREAADEFGLRWIRSEPLPGLSRDLAVIHEGSNSGYQAINLAFHLGARRIVLLGYDMGATGNTHWFGEHPDEIASSSGARDFGEFLTAFPALAADLKAEGVDVVNCTTTTALAAFRRARLEDTL